MKQLLKRKLRTTEVSSLNTFCTETIKILVKNVFKLNMIAMVLLYSELLYLTFSAEPDLQDQPKRKRIRRRKSKKNIQNLSDVVLNQAELETQPGLLQEKMHPQLPDAPIMSKNKRKKLKKKLQLRRKKEAGSVAKPCGISFLYQPESGSEAEADSIVGRETEEDQEGSVTDATQEDIELANSKADSILSFLRSTQEIYFYDGRVSLLPKSPFEWWQPPSIRKMLQLLLYKTH